MNQTLSIASLIEENEQKLREAFPNHTIQKELNNALRAEWEEYSFAQADIAYLSDYEKKPLFSLELSLTEKDTDEPATSLYTDVYLDGFMVPLSEKGKSEAASMSVHFGESESGDIEIERFIVSNQDEYDEVIKELSDMIQHHFAVLGLTE